MDSRCRFEHIGAARKMETQRVDVHLLGFVHGVGSRLRNIVEF